MDSGLSWIESSNNTKSELHGFWYVYISSFLIRSRQCPIVSSYDTLLHVCFPNWCFMTTEIMYLQLLIAPGFLLHICPVYTSNWHMEYWLYLCWGFDWEATFSWKEYSSPTGFDNWSSWNTFNGYHFSCMDHVSLKLLVVNFKFSIFSTWDKPALCIFF